MIPLTKSDTLDTLGLPPGEHWVRFHVENDLITFEVAGSSPAGKPARTGSGRTPTGFVEQWGGSVRKQDDRDDIRLTYINEKHLR